MEYKSKIVYGKPEIDESDLDCIINKYAAKGYILNSISINTHKGGYYPEQTIVIIVFEKEN